MLGREASTTCKLRLIGLPMPIMPIAKVSLADVFFFVVSSAAASTCWAYQLGSPAALKAASERWRKPRRERLPLSTFIHPPRNARKQTFKVSKTLFKVGDAS